MQRKIKFRGKHINSGDYYYGYYINKNGNPYILQINSELQETTVQQETMAQRIGYDIIGFYVKSEFKEIPCRAGTTAQLIGYDVNNNEVYENDTLIDNNGKYVSVWDAIRMEPDFELGDQFENFRVLNLN